MQARSASEAREQGLSRYFTGKPCKRGHVTERYTSTKNCVKCVRVVDETWDANNPGKRQEYMKKYRSNNPLTEEDRIKGRKACLAWQKRNRAYCVASVMKRDAAKIQRTPSWADNDKILEFYKLSAKLTEETKIRHHVDHIIPLRGELVSGLHVHYNLQVIPAHINISKKNKFNPEEHNA